MNHLFCATLVSAISALVRIRVVAYACPHAVTSHATRAPSNSRTRMACSYVLFVGWTRVSSLYESKLSIVTQCVWRKNIENNRTRPIFAKFISTIMLLLCLFLPANARADRAKRTRVETMREDDCRAWVVRVVEPSTDLFSVSVRPLLWGTRASAVSVRWWMHVIAPFSQRAVTSRATNVSRARERLDEGRTSVWLLGRKASTWRSSKLAEMREETRRDQGVCL